MILIQVGGWDQPLYFETPQDAVEFIDAALENGATSIGLEVQS